MAEKSKKEQIEEFKKKVTKQDSVSKEDFARQLATRELLERDFKEDTIRVSFNTSPETRRTVLTRKPSPKEYITLLTLYIQGAKLEGSNEVEALKKMTEIQSNIHKLAAKLTVDKKLDETFWSTCVSFSALQSFVNELMIAVQQGTMVPEGEMKSFRGK